MRVVFGMLDDMLSELNDKCIKEVRVESGCCFVSGAWSRPKLEPLAALQAIIGSVAVEALLLSNSMGMPLIYGRHESLVHLGPTASEETEIREEVEAARKEIIEKLERRGFTVRAGHFEEG